jgi:peptide deformylase
MSRILKILTNPNPVLRKKSKRLGAEEIKSKEIKNLCADMVKTMLAKDGVGLAAPQIGKNIRLCAVNTKDGEICLINPKIIKKSWAKELGEEGCLSFPGLFGEVRRHKKIICEFLDREGKENIVEAEGLLARVIQHETDHLDGILFVDKAKNLKEMKSNNT